MLTRRHIRNPEELVAGATSRLHHAKYVKYA